MIRNVRNIGRSIGDLLLYVAYTGRWWLPATMVVLVVTTLLIAFVQVAAPVFVYTLF